MIVWIGVINKQSQAIPHKFEIDLCNAFNRNIAESEMFQCENVYGEGNRSILAYFWTQEEDEDKQFLFDERFFSVVAGDVYGLEYERTNIDKQTVSRCYGMFNLATIDKANNVIKAYNNHARIHNVYYMENDEYILVSNRILILQQLCFKSKKPVIDYNNLSGMLHRGYVPYNETIFKGVKILDPYSEILVKENHIQISPIEEIDYFSEEISECIVDELTQSLIDMMKTIKNNQRFSTKIELTGGKDSRLIVSAASYVGMDFYAETYGYESGAEAIVARQIAKKLNIEHNIKSNELYEKTFIEKDVLGRTQKTLFYSDGGVYGFEDWEDINLQSSIKKREIILRGWAGEIWRGGYAKRLRCVTEKEVQGKMQRLCFPMEDFFLPDVEKHYTECVNSILRNIPQDTPEVMDWYYLYERMGKWQAPFFQLLSYREKYSIPLGDERIIKKLLSIRSIDKIDEKLMYNVLQRLNPDLAKMPLANARWNFEKNGPVDGREEEYNSRTPIQGSSAGNFDWRRQTLTDMKKQFASVIFDKNNDFLFEIVNKSKVEQLILGDNSQYLGQFFPPIFVWNLYTASVLLEGSWYRNHTGKGKGYFFNSQARKKAKIYVR